MLFTQPSFLFLFLPVLLAGYFVLPRQSAARNVLLLAASVLFYATGAGRFTWLILALIVFNYAAARAVDRARKTRVGWWILAAAVAADLSVLAVFKYADFTVA